MDINAETAPGRIRIERRRYERQPLRLRCYYTAQPRSIPVPAGVTRNLSRNGILVQWTAEWVPRIGAELRLYIEPPAPAPEARSFRCRCRVVRLALSEGGTPEVAVAVARADFRAGSLLTAWLGTGAIQ